MSYDEMRALIAERHSESVYRTAAELGINFVAIISERINTIGTSDELMDMLGIAPITAEGAADAAYWEIVKACEAAYFGRLSRDEIEVLAKALRATGTLRLGDDMEYNGSTIVYAWDRATADR